MHRGKTHRIFNLLIALFTLGGLAFPVSSSGYAKDEGKYPALEAVYYDGYAKTSVDLQAPTPILMAEPTTLFPAYGSGMCDSGWYLYTASPEYDPYLTLNATNNISGTLHAEWRPSILTPGYYRVEAFVPSHAAIDWLCPAKHIAWDTVNAKYQIHHQGGITEVPINQAPLNDEWVTLGEFAFTAGSTGFVSLSAATDEVSQTRTVSFSAVRFTWYPPRTYTSHLPQILNGYSKSVKVTEAHTADAGGNSLDVFRLGDPINYAASGVNQTGKPASAQITFTVTGPCGPGVILNTTRTFPVDPWSETLSKSVPTCPGVYTFEARVTYFARTSTQTSIFVVNPESGVIISPKPAFDACQIGSVSQMQTWWNKSPYYSTNLYIGGISLSSGCTDLTPVWVTSVALQGWSFIPTWVGPQAPCSSFRKKMVNDAGQAYLQGRDNADSAVAASNALGFSSSTIIYYDLEGFSGATTACRNVVKSFINGWVERLHEYGVRAGVYGGARSSYPLDWLTLPHVPDDVWIASWYTPYKYDPAATVWNIPGVPNEVWPNHQRIKQYSGGHSETWGGVSIGIDSDIADGEVVLMPQGYAAHAAPTPPASEVRIESFGVTTAENGWVIKGGRLYATSDSGRSWNDITPAGATASAAEFTTDTAGWLVSVAPGEARLWRTADGGAAWQPDSIPLDFEPGQAQISFSDARHGWLAVQQMTGSAFSLGVLWVTGDGGFTWTKRTLPAYGQVSFIDEDHGWLAGGAGNNLLYRTVDGGQTWIEQNIGYTQVSAVQAPVQDAAGRFYLAVTIASPDAAQVEIITSADDGQTWSLANRITLKSEAAAGAPARLALRGDGGLWVILPGENRLQAVSASGGSLASVTALPEGARLVQFSSETAGWVLAESGECFGDKLSPNFTCTYQTALYRTLDGGQTWVEISNALP